MNGNEIFDIAMQAMPLNDMDAATQGHVYGVLSLALMLQEAEHNEQLRLGDEELQDARRKWAEQHEALTMGSNAKIAANNALNAEVRKLSQQCDAMAAEFDAKQRELDELRSARDETVAGLQAENSRLHRSLEERMTAHIPGAVQVAKTEELHGMAKVHLVPAGSEDL